MTRLPANEKTILNTIKMFKTPVKKSFLYLEYKKHYTKSDIDYILDELVKKNLIKEVGEGYSTNDSKKSN